MPCIPNHILIPIVLENTFQESYRVSATWTPADENVWNNLFNKWRKEFALSTDFSREMPFADICDSLVAKNIVADDFCYEADRQIYVDGNYPMEAFIDIAKSVVVSEFGCLGVTPFFT